MAEEFDVVILGAGAAGLMCALTAARRGRRVLLLDHAEEPGRKILISGGGRCNFTNTGCAPENFLSANPHFCRSALARYTPGDIVTLIEKHGIAWHEKTLGQLFCDGSARQVVRMLLDECSAVHVDLRTGHTITDVSRSERFRIVTTKGSFSAQALVLATGGLSIPRMGATDFTHRMAKRFGLGIVSPRPGLVPLVFDGELRNFMTSLSGVSANAIVSCNRAAFNEALLFTHRGLSGPAVLQASSYWHAGDTVEIDLLPGVDAAAVLRDRKRDRPKAEARTLLSELLPRRLAEALCAATLPDRPIGETPDKALSALGARINRWRIAPAGSEGFAKAEVTVGGVDTAGLSSKTMEATEVPGLYVIGEAVDVTGWLGGYNFQWAWASGHAAGMAV